MSALHAIPFSFENLADAPASRESAAPADGGAALARAFAEGHAAGRAAAQKDARDAAAAEAARIVEAIVDRRNAFDAAVAAAAESIRDDARELVKLFAERLNAAHEMERALQLVDRMLAASPDRAEATLRLSQDCFLRSGGAIAAAVAARGAADFIRIAPDETLEPGEAALIWRGGAASCRNAAVAEFVDRIFAADVKHPPTEQQP